MAGARARTNKRSSNSPCSTTITTIIIASMCIMGLWLLSPNSIIVPLSTTRTSTATVTAVAADSAHNKIPVFDDSEENLPDDAIKPDDIKEVVVADNNDEKKEEENETNGENLQKREDDQVEEEKQNVSDGKTSQDQIKHDEDVVVRNKDNQETGEQQHESHGKTSKDQIEHDEEEIVQNKDNDQATSDEKKDNQETTEQQHESHGNDGEEIVQNKDNDQTNNDEKKDNQETTEQHESHDEEETVRNEEDNNNNQTPEDQNEKKKKTSKHQIEQDEEEGHQKNVVKEDNQNKWQLCNVTAGPDCIPCLDNEKAIAKLRSRKHFEHRERHCPDEPPTCLVPMPQGYKKSVKWPQSRDKVWYANVPRTELAIVKGHQNWMKVTGEFLTFPGGGTQFIHGALHYIDFLQEAVQDIAWGKHTRVILDIGCGVASFGGYLFKKDVITMSMAPKDEHEAQVQFALERGIPAISGVMGSQRLPFPSKVFDLIQCARCRIPWHANGGLHLLEVDRVLRPGGFFVWSETPVYQTLPEDVQQWKDMTNLTTAMCWEIVAIKKDKLNSIGAAIYQKPSTNECYDKRKQKQPPMCKSDDEPNASWYVPLETCIHRVPAKATERGTEWPEEWPDRLQTPPYWLNRSQTGFYGKPATEDFVADSEKWKQVVSKLYLHKLGIDWSGIRNIMDMNAIYGGFAAALKELEVWVMNVVNIDSPDTLPIIFERGLLGIRHDWCESFSTYPRTYDLLHADHLFSKLKKRCGNVPVLVEIDRIVRPEGHLIVRDDSSTIGEVKSLLKSLHWEVNMTISSKKEVTLSARKLYWRPNSYAAAS